MIDKVQKIREEVARIQLYTQSEVLKQVLDYIDEVQKEPVSDIWHDASEPPIIDKTFLLVAPNGNSSLCLWGGKKLHSVTIGGGHSVLCKGDIYSYIDDLLNLDNSCNFGKNLQEESVSEKKCIFTKDSYTYEDRKVLCKDCKEKCEYSKKEEPVSEDLGKVGSLKSLEYYPEKKTTNKTSKGVFDANMPRRKAYLRGFKDGAHAHKELIANKPVSEDLGGYINELSKQFPEVSFAKLSRIAVRVAKWQKENLWKPADGGDLPEIDREVIALVAYDFGHYKVVYAHRPNPNGWNGTNIDTGEVEHFEPEIYDKGGWNQPHVLYWLDTRLPYEENKIDK